MVRSDVRPPGLGATSLVILRGRSEARGVLGPTAWVPGRRLALVSSRRSATTVLLTSLQHLEGARGVDDPKDAEPPSQLGNPGGDLLYSLDISYRSGPLRYLAFGRPSHPPSSGRSLTASTAPHPAHCYATYAPCPAALHSCACFPTRRPFATSCADNYNVPSSSRRALCCHSRGFALLRPGTSHFSHGLCFAAHTSPTGQFPA